jgi:hypothetical protein
MVKPITITEDIVRVYKGRKIDLICKRCGKNFEINDEVYKCSRKKANKKNVIRLFCPECTFAEPREYYEEIEIVM